MRIIKLEEETKKNILEDLIAINTGESTTVYMEEGIRRSDIVEWLPKIGRLTNFKMVEDNSKVKEDTYYVLTTDIEKYQDVLIEEINMYTYNKRDIYLIHIKNENKKSKGIG